MGILMAARPFTLARALSRVDDLYLNPDLTKAQVKALAVRCLEAGIINDNDNKEVIRMAADRDWCAEDVLSELRAILLSVNDPFNGE